METIQLILSKCLWLATFKMALLFRESIEESDWNSGIIFVVIVSVPFLFKNLVIVSRIFLNLINELSLRKFFLWIKSNLFTDLRLFFFNVVIFLNQFKSSLMNLYRIWKESSCLIKLLYEIFVFTTIKNSFDISSLINSRKVIYPTTNLYEIEYRKFLLQSHISISIQNTRILYYKFVPQPQRLLHNHSLGIFNKMQ